MLIKSIRIISDLFFLSFLSGCIGMIVATHRAGGFLEGQLGESAWQDFSFVSFFMFCVASTFCAFVSFSGNWPDKEGSKILRTLYIIPFISPCILYWRMRCGEKIKPVPKPKKFPWQKQVDP